MQKVWPQHSTSSPIKLTTCTIEPLYLGHSPQVEKIKKFKLSHAQASVEFDATLTKTFGAQQLQKRCADLQASAQRYDTCMWFKTVTTPKQAQWQKKDKRKKRGKIKKKLLLSVFVIFLASDSCFEMARWFKNKKKKSNLKIVLNGMTRKPHIIRPQDDQM